MKSHLQKRAETLVNSITKKNPKVTRRMMMKAAKAVILVSDRKNKTT